MNQPSTPRLALWSGIVFAVLTFAGMIFFIVNLATKLAPFDAPLNERIVLYTDYGQLITLNNYLWVLPVPFFIVFVAGLHSLMRRSEGEDTTLSTSMLLAGGAMVIPWLALVAVETIGVVIAQNGGDAATVWALDSLGVTSTMGLAGLARAVFLGAISLHTLKHRTVNRWFARIGLFLAVVCLVGSLTFVVGSLFPLAWLSLILVTLWVLALSIALLRQPRTVPTLVPAHA